MQDVSCCGMPVILTEIISAQALRSEAEERHAVLSGYNEFDSSGMAKS